MKPTPEQIAEVQRQIKVQQDWIDWKVIQAKYHGPQGQWQVDYAPTWNWHDFDYRTKPEPPTVWAADLETEWPSFCVRHDPPNRALREWRKYTLHEVLP